jgi:PPM family protein phosphatase
VSFRAADITLRTDTGRQRAGNEDNAYARAPLFVVADGMGGAQAGEVASGIAIETFEEELPGGDTAEQRLAERVQEANRRIYELSRSDREHAGMGTTLTAAYLEPEDVAIAHVGDSRAYLLRDGELRRLTRDHSLVDELLQRGKLTEEQAAEHPQRSIITRALGPEAEVEVDTWSYPARAGDVFLLCSDGLTSMVHDKDVQAILVDAPTLSRAGDELIAAANAAGGRDNITVVLFRVEEIGEGLEDDGATMVGAPAVSPTAATKVRGEASGPRAQAVAAPVPTFERPQRGMRARAHPAAPRRRPHHPPVAPDGPRRREGRWIKPLAALVAIVIVVGVIGGAGYLATRQLYFIGTNNQGVVTIYRGLPYDLPVGIRLYETYYVSGVPATIIPADRRPALLDNHLRSQTDATNVIKALELGKIQQ